MLRSHDVGCGVLCCNVVWAGVMWCGVVGYRAIGLAVWLVEWFVGYLFAMVCCYVGLFGKLRYFRGV